MHDETTATPPTAPPHDEPAGPPPDAPVVPPTRSGRSLCMSVFDRWRCGLDAGHVGMHVAAEAGATTSWNDAVAGRMLRDL